MWPTFHIPMAMRQAGQTDCFDLYTKLVSTSRFWADGFEFDPELQFTAKPNTAYWMYGYLRFDTPVATGGPGAMWNFAHSGDTVAFQSMGDIADGFRVADPETIVAALHLPVPLAGLGATGYHAYSTGVTTYIFRSFIDAVLITGASGGTLGIKWGCYSAGGGSIGYTRLLADSYFTAIEITPP